MLMWPTVPPYIPTLDSDVNFYLHLKVSHPARVCTIKIVWFFSSYIWYFFAPVPQVSWDDDKNLIKTHSSVLCGPKNGTCANGMCANGTCANGVSILTGRTKLRFSRILSSVMPHPKGTKFAVELLSIRRIPYFKFERNPISHSWYTTEQNFLPFFSSFRVLCKNYYNPHMHTSIWLKFGTPIGGLKANTGIKFGVNLINN